ncbi:MAG: biotin--[acetyl-CoA-carboxylase] ligase [Giesbergeria sp.]|nr:biotin--[acetyl-CoA-carboxylase] ligase [Giesbergeria sp.]MBP6419618.1 biotin--[acetyl-CoA-carboxylase] ligase [Giesbergeria sp.]
MSHSPIRWPAEAIWQAVAPQLPGFTIEVLPCIDSTNTELMRRARAGRCEPILLVAEQQTAGRGRLGREWHSGTDAASLTFSLGLPLAPLDWSGLSLAVGVSVAESLQPLLPAPDSRTPRIGLKWPNDLWLGGAAGERKLGGILVETASFVAPQRPALGSAVAPRYVVVGVGLNVLPRADAGLSIPAGCLQEVDAALDAPTALARIAAPLVAMLQSFELYGFEPMQPRFALRDVLQERLVTLSDGSRGTAHGVAPDGALLVHTAQGMQSVTSADVSVRPAPS